MVITHSGVTGRLVIRTRLISRETGHAGDLSTEESGVMANLKSSKSVVRNMTLYQPWSMLIRGSLVLGKLETPWPHG